MKQFTKDELKTLIKNLAREKRLLEGDKENLKKQLANLESEANAEYREKHSLYNSFCTELEENKRLKEEIDAVRAYFIKEQNNFFRNWEAERIEYGYKSK